MGRRRIGAVTFDLWDCLFMDDTDEPKRAAAALAPKPVARRELAHTFLERHEPVSRATVDLAYDVVDAAFRVVWHDQHVTWTVAERLQVLLSGMGRELPEAELAELVALHENMELEFRPDPAPGAREALATLHGKYPLIVLSDAIFSPGRVLRELLDDAGMLDYFDECIFSDELGFSKPAAEVFHAAADIAGCDIEELVHIGDRPHNDIGGPRTVGARAVLLTVVKTRPLEGHCPDAVCSDYATLPAILDKLDVKGK